VASLFPIPKLFKTPQRPKDENRGKGREQGGVLGEGTASPLQAPHQPSASAAGSVKDPWLETHFWPRKSPDNLCNGYKFNYFFTAQICTYAAQKTLSSIFL